MGQRAVILLCLLAVVAASDRPKRLTAFGKVPSQDPSPIPQGKGRECKSQEECEAVPYTSCLLDGHGRRRCLCKDLNPPHNGQCAVKVRVTRGYVPFLGNRRPEQEDARLFVPATRPVVFPQDSPPSSSSTTAPPLFRPAAPIGLRQTCNKDEECLDGGECKIDRNSTTHSNNKGKVCLCRVGHMEIDNQCSGGDSLMPSLTLAAALVLLLTASTFNIN